MRLSARGGVHMLNKLKRILAAALLLYTAGESLSQAQEDTSGMREVTVADNRYSGFGRIVANGRFDISLCNSDECRTIVSADREISQYVHVYVKDSTLYLELDDAAFPPELKKVFSGRNAAVPVLKAEIHVDGLRSLVMHDNVVLDNSGEFTADSLSLFMDGSSMISSLDLSCRHFSMNMTRNSSANVSVSADSLDIRTSAASELEISCEAGTASFMAEGSSSVRVSGDFGECRLFSESSGHFEAEGSASHCYVTGRGASRIDVFIVSNQG